MQIGSGKDVRIYGISGRCRPGFPTSYHLAYCCWPFSSDNLSAVLFVVGFDFGCRNTFLVRRYVFTGNYYAGGVSMARNKVADLSVSLGCSYNLAQDLYRLGDKDSEHIAQLSQECGGIERLKTALLLERLEQIDISISDLWEAIDKQKDSPDDE